MCMPGYKDGYLNCADNVCEADDIEENTCTRHGDGIIHDVDKVPGNFFLLIELLVATRASTFDYLIGDNRQ